MRTRSAGSIPFARTCGAIAALSSLSSAAAKVCCSSRSASTALLPDCIGLACFAQQDFERRNVRVPLDERRHIAEPAYDLRIERPHIVTHRRAVRVDQDLAAVEVVHGVTGEMDLADRTSRDVGEILARIEAMIARADVDIVDVEEDAAA